MSTTEHVTSTTSSDPRAAADPLIERERKQLEVQMRLLDILEPLTDAQRIRVLRAVEALLTEPTGPELLRIEQAREKARKAEAGAT